MATLLLLATAAALPIPMSFEPAIDNSTTRSTSTLHRRLALCVGGASTQPRDDVQVANPCLFELHR